MNKTFIIALSCIALVLAGPGPVENEEKYTIDQASSILNELLEDSRQNLGDLNKNWDENKPILENTIANAETALQNKQAECEEHDNVLAGHQKDLEEARKYGEWLRKRINENEERIVQVMAERCTQNGIFVEGLKNDKIAMKLVEFLRAQIEAKESFDFAQRKAFMKNLKSFLAIYASGDYAELIQLEKQVASDYQVDVDDSVKGRSSEEIGSGHVDNDKDQLELDEFQNGARKGWAEVRAELLEILKSLEETIQEKVRRSQDDEVKSSIAAAEYKLQLEHEIEVYRRELAKQENVIRQLESTVAENEESCKQCRQDESNRRTDVETAKEDLRVQTNTHDHKQSELEEEIQIFIEVISLYLPSTGDQSDSFKERADDYIEDSEFDNDSYSDREVPDIELMNSQN